MALDSKNIQLDASTKVNSKTTRKMVKEFTLSKIMTFTREIMLMGKSKVSVSTAMPMVKSIVATGWTIRSMVVAYGLSKMERSKRAYGKMVIGNPGPALSFDNDSKPII